MIVSLIDLGEKTRKNNLINKIISFINKNLVVLNLINQKLLGFIVFGLKIDYNWYKFMENN